MKITYLAYFPILLLLSPIYSFGQKSTELLNEFERLARFHQLDDIDSSIYYTAKIISTAKQENDQDWLAFGYTFNGVLKKQIGQLDSAIFYYKLAITIQLATDFEEGAAGNYNNLGTVFKLKGDYIESVKYYQKSKSIFQDKLMFDQFNEVIQNISELLIFLGKYNDAQAELESAKIFYENENNKKGKTWIKYCESEIKLAQGDSTKAIKMFKETLIVFDSVAYHSMSCKIRIRLCELLLPNFQMEEIEMLSDEAFEIAYSKNLQLELNQCYILKGKIAIRFNKPYDAINYFHKVIHKKSENITQELLRESYLYLSIAFEKIGSIEESLFYYKKYHSIQQQLSGLELQKDFQALQVEYQVLEKDRELYNLKNEQDSIKIEMLEKENLLQKQTFEVEQGKVKMYYVLGAIILISIALFFYIAKFREKKQLSMSLKKTVDERDLLIKEIHHRVKNNLQIINSLLNLQKNRGVNLSVGDVISQTQDRIYAMSIIHEKLYQTDDFVNIDVREYLETLISYFEYAQNFKSKNIILESELASFSLPIDKLIPLGLIINEVLSNASKYAFDESGGTIHINVIKHNDSFQMQYIDTGIGLPDTLDHKKPNSLGFKLIHGFTSQLDGKLEVINDNGLKMFFTFNVKIN